MIKKNKTLILLFIFWLALTLYNVFDELSYSNLTDSVIYGISQSAVLGLIVYLNIMWLIPKLLYKKKHIRYVMGLIASTVFFILFVFYLDSLLYPIENSVFYSNYKEIFFEIMQALIMVGGISSIWVMLEQVQTKERLVLVEKEQIETDLKFLKAQTNPHFLFNVLNNIHFLINKDPKGASETLMKLSNLLRYQLYETNTERVSIGKEIEHIKNYVELERIRIGKRLNLQSHFDCDNTGVQIAPFLLLPLIENAFKHSLSTENTFISFWLKVEVGQIDFKVENSLSDVDDKNIVGGLGISNLKQRLELLYPMKYVYEYGIKEDKYIAQLKIDLD